MKICHIHLINMETFGRYGKSIDSYSQGMLVNPWESIFLRYFSKLCTRIYMVIPLNIRFLHIIWTYVDDLTVSCAYIRQMNKNPLWSIVTIARNERQDDIMSRAFFLQQMSSFFKISNWTIQFFFTLGKQTRIQYSRRHLRRRDSQQ